MKYLKSSTNKAYVIQGRTVPPLVNKGNQWLSVTDDEYIIIKKIAAVGSLIDAGAIIVRDKSPQHANMTVTENAGLKEELQQSQTALKEATAAREASEARFRALKSEAEQALAEKDAEIAKLKEQLTAQEDVE